MSRSPPAATRAGAPPWTGAPPPLLSVEGLSVSYQDSPCVLEGVDLAVDRGELCCIMGANGAGKTTLLRTILGELRPTRGTVLLGGRPGVALGPLERARFLAYVPQASPLDTGFSIEELVLLGRHPHLGPLGLAGPDDMDVVRHALERTGTAHLAARRIDAVSGGEAQRAMVARALAQEPVMLLLDEPTSHMDLKHQLAIYELLSALAGRGMGVLAVSHEINVASRFAHRLVMLADGRILADGPPAEVLRPDTLEAVFGVAVSLVPVSGGPPVVLGRPRGSAA